MIPCAACIGSASPGRLDVEAPWLPNSGKELPEPPAESAIPRNPDAIQAQISCVLSSIIAPLLARNPSFWSNAGAIGRFLP